MSKYPSATPQIKGRWESSEFPIVCETCLGENPYVRMMKAEFDKECKVCARPFTVFRWRPGANARFKKTEICQTCAKIKNVCQTCLLDLEWGLPVQVRDASLPTQVPQSDVHREWFADQAERQIATGQLTYNKSEERATLMKLARQSPYYKRNEAHICSFFVKGQCNRGSECPYRHELPEENDLSHQNIKDRYNGVNDPVAKKLLSKVNALKISPPADQTVKTLYVGNVDSSITEEDIRGAFYAYGEIQEVKMVAKSMCAFVTYTTRSAAEKAAEQLFNNLSIKGFSPRLAWSRSQILDAPLQTNTYSTTQTTASSQNYFSLPTSTPTPNMYIPPPPNPSISKPHYSSMNPQRFGAKSDR